MNKLKYILQILILVLWGCTETSSNCHEYIDQLKPSLKPRLFSKGYITKDSISEFGSVFNKAQDQFYFAIDSADRAFIKYTQCLNGTWTSPITIISDSIYSFNDPFLSNDETKLYYISDKPRNPQDTINDYDIWYSNKINGAWSKPINAGLSINSDANDYYISFAENGAMYFSSNRGKSEKRLHDFDIYKSEFKNGKFETPQKLSETINTGRYEADVFIAPDESYIIYCSAKKSGYGRGDLYISFKDENENWMEPVNMGNSINTVNHELCPFVTKDGKYFFYTSNQDIYWVSTNIFKTLRVKLR